MTATPPEPPAVTPALAWEAWYASERSTRTMEQDFEDSKYDAMYRAFLAGTRATLAARQPQPAPGDVRASLESLAAFWVREYAAKDNWADVCAGQLLDVLGGAREPEPEQPAPGLAAAMPDLGTAWRLLNETRERLNQLAAEFSAATENDSIDGYTRGSLYMAIRAEMLHQAAGRIREALEGK